MAIKCCYHCVPPKRHDKCHSDCPEHLAEKAEYERLKALDDSRRSVKNSIFVQRSNSFAKNMRKRGRKI